MTEMPVNLLFIEDSRDDVQLALLALERDGLRPSWKRVATEVELREALESSTPDAILSDFFMPEFDGLAALEISRQFAPRVPFIFVSGTIGAERENEALPVAALDGLWQGETAMLNSEGKEIPVSQVVIAHRASDGGIRFFSTIARDISERKAYEKRIKHLANYDALSGLPNRSLLSDRTAQAMTHARRVGRPCALIVLDIDRFKRVNDSYGRNAGDALLRQVGARVRGPVRDRHTTARLEAASFAVLAADLARPDDVLNVTRKVHALFKVPFSIEGHDVHATLSIGASVFPRDGDNFDVLLGNADVAMHRAKANGGNGFQIYAAAMTHEATERIEIENALRTAFARRELELHYQPQVDITSGRIRGVEALMRWRHAERGWIPPAQFIPVAEESYLIQPLGD